MILDLGINELWPAGFGRAANISFDNIHFIKCFLKRSLWVQNLQMLLQKQFDPLFCCSDLDEAVCTSHWSSREVNVQPVTQSQVLSSPFMLSSDLNSD